MIQTTDLSQLQDIVETSAPNWWPPAPGWLVLAALLLVLLSSLLIFLRRYYRRRRIKRLALLQLKQLSDDCRPSDITLLLKQAALGYFTRQQIAPLQGRQWLQFLIAGLPSQRQADFSIDTIERELYVADAEVRHYRYLAACWLSKALPPSKRSTQLTEAS